MLSEEETHEEYRRRCLDEELLLERADAGWKLLRDQKNNVDPYDVLAAIVWPSPAAVAAQLEQRLEALKEG